MRILQSTKHLLKLLKNVCWKQKEKTKTLRVIGVRIILETNDKVIILDCSLFITLHHECLNSKNAQFHFLHNSSFQNANSEQLKWKKSSHELVSVQFSISQFWMQWNASNDYLLYKNENCNILIHAIFLLNKIFLAYGKVLPAIFSFWFMHRRNRINLNL